ncbi:hypothetical protein [Nocardia sp. CC227C]|uniref:hypothetical protein n=1 Tax=Nocardia sp. CC227C TaxID=3044562 RepID=UPI00278C7F46|nr:hypothetical protein [Nocardia sp. CC227C]
MTRPAVARMPAIRVLTVVVPPVITPLLFMTTTLRTVAAPAVVAVPRLIVVVPPVDAPTARAYPAPTVMLAALVAFTVLAARTVFTVRRAFAVLHPVASGGVSGLSECAAHHGMRGAGKRRTAVNVGVVRR